MKKILVLSALLAISGSLFSQNIYRRDYDNMNRPLFEPDSQVTTGIEMAYWQPFDDMVGYSIYGSRYRKAKTNRNRGAFLCEIVAPISALVALGGIENDTPGTTIVGVAGLAGSLGAGIPLWRKGRRELDRMLDDYARRYAPRPYSSSISAGPTPHGIGLALNF